MPSTSLGVSPILRGLNRASAACPKFPNDRRKFGVTGDVVDVEYPLTTNSFTDVSALRNSIKIFFNLYVFCSSDLPLDYTVRNCFRLYQNERQWHAVLRSVFELVFPRHMQ